MDYQAKRFAYNRSADHDAESPARHPVVIKHDYGNILPRKIKRECHAHRASADDDDGVARR